MSLPVLGSAVPRWPRSPLVPRLPLVPDPLRRARIPKDLDAVTTYGREADPADAGMTRDNVERMWRSVRRLYRSGTHPAIALCLRRDGHVVIDRAIGHARGNGPGEPRGATRVPVTPQSPFCVFSASKAITATLIHLLDERGLLHVDDRVVEYIPEYAKNGKDAITIRHVLAHRAGVANLPGEALDLERITDDEFIVDLLCAATPVSRPGRALAYHAISGGYILAEVARRVTGSDIRTLLAEEICRPLGFRWMNYGVDADDVGRVVRNYPTGFPVLPPLSSVLERALGLPVDEITRVSNDPRFLTGVVPAGNIVTTAEELCRFFELLRRGGDVGGVRILQPRTIRRALTEQSYREIDFTLGFPTRYAMGFMLGARLLSVYGPNTEHAFGHLGFSNTIGWADPERLLSGALLTSGKPILYPELADWWGVMRRIGLEAPRVDDVHRAPTAAHTT